MGTSFCGVDIASGTSGSSDKGCTLVHCYGGCGRSGIALLRLMCEAGEAPDHALERLSALAQ